MGFFDKIKEKAKQIKEENKNFGSTMKRINSSNLYGNVNRDVKGGDFFNGSYINIENGKGLIYSSAQDDYVFGAEDIKKCTFIGNGTKVAVGQNNLLSLRFLLEFNDGKKAEADIIVQKVDAFKAALGIQ